MPNVNAAIKDWIEWQVAGVVGGGNPEPEAGESGISSYSPELSIQQGRAAIRIVFLLALEKIRTEKWTKISSNLEDM